MSASEHLDHARSLVQRNVYWAMGAGVLPMPLFDVLAVTSVQLKMLRELSDVYGFEFSKSLARRAVTLLFLGVGGVGVGGLLGASFVKFVPFVGAALGAVSVPIVSGALTFAVGRTFIMHFEAGGTLLDFDPMAMRSHFKHEYEQAKIVVTELRKPGAPGPSTHPIP